MKIEIPEHKKLVHEMRFPVRWGDMDAMGHVNNTVYFRYLELQYPDEVLLKLYVSDPGRTTFETWGTMERIAEPGVVCAAGGATTIWVDFPRQKAMDLPDWMRTLVTP